AGALDSKWADLIVGGGLGPWREVYEPVAPRVEIGVPRNQQRADACRSERRECSRKLLVAAGLGDNDGLIDATGRLFDLRQLVWGKDWIEQNPDEWDARRQVAQQPETLRLHSIWVHGIAGGVAARPVEALDQSLAYRISAYSKYNWNGRCGALGRARRRIAANRDEHAYVTADEIGRHRRQQIVLTARPSVLDGQI